MKLDRIERVIPTALPQFAENPKPISRTNPAAAKRFAAACARLPGARVLRDVALDEVLVSFGGRTQEVRDRLYARGFHIKIAEWGTQNVLRIPFSGHSFGDEWAEDLADAIERILSEMGVADTRVW
jgi:hypothetical protein